MSDSQNSLREFYKTDVILMSASLSKNLKELKEELIKEVQEMLNIFESMEQKVNGRSPNENILQNEIDRLLEVSLTSVESSNSIIRPKSKDIKSKDRVLKNNNDKRPSAHVQKMSSSVIIDSNKRETMHSNVARYALSRNSSLKRALFTTLIAAKSKHLGATSVVEKSRLSVTKTPTATNKVIQFILWIVDSGCSKHMSGNLQLLRNFVKKFMGIVRFGNDHFAAITGYGDYVQGNLTVCHVYYIEGLGHNLFLVRQFCDGDLEVAFRSNTCYVWNLEGDDLLTGSHDSNLYTISISEMAASSPACLISRATSTKSWLWHHRLSHLNFGKSNKALLPPKLVPRTESKLELLHMDLCGLMRVASINDKKYILVIVDDYSRYTWNRSIIHTRYNKTPYELIHGRKPNIQYFHVFGSLCYPTNDHDDLGKMKPKADIEYYATSSTEVSDNSAVINLDNENTSSSSSIVAEEDEAPQIVSLSVEQVATEPNSSVLNENADELV
ncbi:retrovirus-related pol polyprotein from transposon TNT 1-94 [Tanacetum coccineum]